MKNSDLKTKILPMLEGLFVAKDNKGVWLRLLLLVVLGNVVGIAVSLTIFFSVRGIGNRIIEPSVSVPDAREVDKEHIKTVLSAFASRATTFQERYQDGISIPDPY